MITDIKILKLNSGEEIVSDVTDAGDVYTLKNPVTVVYQKTEKGLGCGLAPYLPFATGDITVFKSSISSFAEPGKDMINEYNRLFGSGIVMASANDIPQAR
jgi:hypothetical protein